MYDLNFFATPIRSEKRSYAGVIGLLVMILVIVAVAAYYLWQESQANIIRTDIDSKQAYLKSQEVTTKLKELDIIKQKTQLLQNYQATFDVIDSYVDQSALVSTDLLARINATVPQSVIFKNLAIATNIFTIDAVATNNQPIAELIYNLKQTQLFSSVELVNVSLADEITDEKTFTLQAFLKEVITP